MIGKYLIALIALTSSNVAQAQWRYTETTDPMTDVLRVRGYASGDKATVFLGCNKHGRESLFIHFVTKEYLGGRPSLRHIKFRIDGSEPLKAYADHRDHSATVFNVGPSFKGGTLLRGLATGKKLVVQFKDYEQTAHIAIIDIADGRSTIDRVAQACKDTDYIKVMASVPPSN